MVYGRIGAAEQRANAEFIGRARERWPAALDEAERLRRALGRIANFDWKAEHKRPHETVREAMTRIAREAL